MTIYFSIGCRIAHLVCPGGEGLAHGFQAALDGIRVHTAAVGDVVGCVTLDGMPEIDLLAATHAGSHKGQAFVEIRCALLGRREGQGRWRQRRRALVLIESRIPGKVAEVGALTEDGQALVG
jgi:hypothetical protein